MTDIQQFCTEEISRILSHELPEDLVEYILSIDGEQDLVEFLMELNPEVSGSDSVKNEVEEFVKELHNKKKGTSSKVIDPHLRIDP